MNTFSSLLINQLGRNPSPSDDYNAQCIESTIRSLLSQLSDSAVKSKTLQKNFYLKILENIEDYSKNVNRHESLLYKRYSKLINHYNSDKLRTDYSFAKIDSFFTKYSQDFNLPDTTYFDNYNPLPNSNFKYNDPSAIIVSARNYHISKQKLIDYIVSEAIFNSMMGFDCPPMLRFSICNGSLLSINKLLSIFNKQYSDHLNLIKVHSYQAKFLYKYYKFINRHTTNIKQDCRIASSILGNIIFYSKLFIPRRLSTINEIGQVKFLRTNLKLWYNNFVKRGNKKWILMNIRINWNTS